MALSLTRPWDGHRAGAQSLTAHWLTWCAWSQGAFAPEHYESTRAAQHSGTHLHDLHSGTHLHDLHSGTHLHELHSGTHLHDLHSGTHLHELHSGTHLHELHSGTHLHNLHSMKLTGTPLLGCHDHTVGAPLSPGPSFLLGVQCPNQQASVLPPSSHSRSAQGCLPPCQPRLLSTAPTPASITQRLTLLLAVHAPWAQAQHCSPTRRP